MKSTLVTPLRVGTRTVEVVNIDVLTVPDCPNRAPTLERLYEALRSTGTDGAVVTERVIADAAAAAAFGMTGSPTILMDGRDPFAIESAEPSVSCRLYRSAIGIEGAPSLDALIAALSARASDGGTTGDGCCGDDLLAGPGASSATRRIAIRGFAALWHDMRVPITDLTDDAAAVDALVAAGRLDIDNGGVLVGVHGLSARPTAHRIEHAAGSVYTWCALDAIGIPAALAIDATAVTSCPTCDTTLRVALNHGLPEDAGAWRLWLPGGEGTHLVNDFCRHANLYCNPEHLQRAVPPGTNGRSVDVTEAATIGRTTWSDVSSVPHEPHGIT